MNIVLKMKTLYTYVQKLIKIKLFLQKYVLKMYLAYKQREMYVGEISYYI